jgi:hypothetical protein
VERRGGSVRRISRTVPQFGRGDDERAWVAARVSEAVDAVAAATGVAAPVVIGKSLGRWRHRCRPAEGCRRCG